MQIDAGIVSWLYNAVAGSPLLSAAAVVAASWLIWALIAWYVLASWRRGVKHHELAVLMLGGVGVYLVNVLVSNWWFRLRPFVTLGFQPLIDVPAWSKSFPSDHAAAAFFAAYLIARTRSSWRWAYALAAFVALGRVAVGVHYPTDVLFGSCVGLAFGHLTVLLERRFERGLRPQAS